MNQEEKLKVLEHLNRSSTLFNGMVQEVTQSILSSQLPNDINPFESSSALLEGINPGVKLDVKKFLQHQFSLLEQQQKLWQNAAKAMLGESPEPVVSEENGDQRFSDNDWQSNPALSYVKQAYLLNAEFMNHLVSAFEFEDSKLTEQVRFYTRQLISSMAPTNYIFTNPEACREILQTEGESIARGMDNFMRDLKRSPAEAFKVNQVDVDAFVLGKDIANTKGKVVYKNHLMELIQYTATTKKVHQTPLLIVPPFINKYYILDLNEKKSLVKWLVDQGFCVFMISWVNPDENHASIAFDAYINDAVIQALDVVADVTGQPQCHAAGYCVGGTLLGITQAYLVAKGENRILSTSFLTTLFDYSQPGEVGNFMGEKMLPLIEKNVLQKGYLDGRILALGFSLLRENNLFWSFFIENYLKGKDPVPFDVLYWNGDSTNIPAQAYLFYLHNMYVGNKLKYAGQVIINGTAIDLGSIKTPSYCLAALADHIVLWQSALSSAQLLASEVRFVLTESGHVAGVVNPPSRNKYGHWVGASSANINSVSPEQWLSNATLVEGSWWVDWQQWLLQQETKQHSCDIKDIHRVKPYKMGSVKYPALAEAPGEYVMRRLDVPTQPKAQQRQGGDTKGAYSQASPNKAEASVSE